MTDLESDDIDILENINDENLWSLFDKYVDNNPSDVKGKDAKVKSDQVDKIAKEALTYIKALKDELIAGAGGRKEGEDGKPNPEGEISEASNIEKHANLLIVQGKGKDI
jgi:hypothetical protein